MAETSKRVPPDDKRCKAKSRQTKERCKNWALKGTTVCRFHGVNKKTRAAAEAKVKQETAKGKVAALMEKLGITDEDPLEGLLREVGRSAVAVEILGSLVGDLDVQSDLHKPNHLGDQTSHILFKMWSEERERHARFCKMALDAGVQERQVQVAEAQGQMMARVIAAVFDDPSLGLTEAQRRMGKKTAARHLKALPATG